MINLSLNQSPERGSVTRSNFLKQKTFGASDGAGKTRTLLPLIEPRSGAPSVSWSLYMCESKGGLP